MNKAVHSPTAESPQPKAAQIHRRRFSGFVVAIAAAGVAGCVVVPPRRAVVVVPVGVRVRGR